MAGLESRSLAVGRRIHSLAVPAGWIAARGWFVLSAGLGCWLVRAVTGWQELAYAAAALLSLFLACCLLALGRANARVELRLDPRRVEAGRPSTAQIDLANDGRHSLTAAIEVAISSGPGSASPIRHARLAMAPVRPGQRRQLTISLPTQARGVVLVGPARAVRGDPFGLVRRALAASRPEDLIVHPLTTPLEPLGAGVLRDLEGRTTNETSTSDLAFHTLRPYVDGDDVRHVHWASSEKLAGSRDSELNGTAAGGSLLVRQFLDTRRSHLGIIVDTARESFASEQEFELAISLAASVARRAAQDGMDMTVLAGSQMAARARRTHALDTFARIVPEQIPIRQTSQRLITLAPGISLGVVVSGSELGLPELFQAAVPLMRRVTTVALRADSGAEPMVRRLGSLMIVTVGDLVDLRAALMNASVG